MTETYTAPAIIAEPSLPDAPPPAVAEPASEEWQDEAAPAEDSVVRPIAPMAFDGLEPRPIPTPEPSLEWMAPSDLLVDEAYQRGLGPKGEAQVRRIAEQWDWRRVKPCIVAWTDRGFEIIDGQHTAIAAATRGVERIPCMVVEAQEMQDRAGAFVGHNRDRLALSAMHIHRAAVAAGDADALRVESVCGRAGVRLMMIKPGKGQKWRPGETIAVGAIGDLISRQSAGRARQQLQVLVEGGCAPITKFDVKAVELLFTDDEYAEAAIEPTLVSAEIRELGAQAYQEAEIFAATHSIPKWRALAIVWFKRCRKRRRAA